MKESSASLWFTTRILNAGTTTNSRSHSEKQMPPPRVGSAGSSTPFSLNGSSSSCNLGSPVMTPSLFRSSMVIPFSWEKQPGVPKHTLQTHHHHHKDQHRASSPPKLPLPPTLRSNSDPFLSAPRRKKRQEPRPAADPFVLAMLECSREEEEEDRRDRAVDEDPAGGIHWKVSPAVAPKVAVGRRRVAADRFAFVGLYGSCKTTCAVSDSVVRVPRSGRVLAAYGLLTSRPG